MVILILFSCLHLAMLCYFCFYFFAALVRSIALYPSCLVGVMRVGTFLIASRLLSLCKFLLLMGKMHSKGVKSNSIIEIVWVFFFFDKDNLGILI